MEDLPQGLHGVLQVSLKCVVFNAIRNFQDFFLLHPYETRSCLYRSSAPLENGLIPPRIISISACSLDTLLVLRAVVDVCTAESWGVSDCDLAIQSVLSCSPVFCSMGKYLSHSAQSVSSIPIHASPPSTTLLACPLLLLLPTFWLPLTPNIPLFSPEAGRQDSDKPCVAFILVMPPDNATPRPIVVIRSRSGL
jgi:hypothetical protein